jgi:drug/metabolite transporter (DMT)-like permease
MKVPALVMACVICNACAQLLLKFGASGPAGELLKEEVSNLGAWLDVLTGLPILTGIGLWTVSTLLWIYILAGSELSYAYALYGLNYVVTPLLASWFFRESLNSLQYIGVALITLGVGLTVTGRLT